MSERIEDPFVEFDRCREGPVLIVGGLRDNCSVSRCQVHRRAGGASRRDLVSIMDDERVQSGASRKAR
jgi:hypothetical protein